MRGHSAWDHCCTSGEHRGAEEPPHAQWSEEVLPDGDESWDMRDVCTGVFCCLPDVQETSHFTSFQVELLLARRRQAAPSPQGTREDGQE